MPKAPIGRMGAFSSWFIQEYISRENDEQEHRAHMLKESG